LPVHDTPNTTRRHALLVLLNGCAKVLRYGCGVATVEPTAGVKARRRRRLLVAPHSADCFVAVLTPLYRSPPPGRALLTILYTVVYTYRHFHVDYNAACSVKS